MYQDELLFADDEEAARREITACGGRVVFDFRGGALITCLPQSAGPASFRHSKLHPADSLGEGAKRLIDAWKLSRTLEAREEAGPVIRLEHACVAERGASPRAQGSLAASWGLRGRIAVVLLVVGGPGSLGVSDSEWVRVQAEALMGLRFLESLNPAGELELAVYDPFDIRIGVQTAACTGQEKCNDRGDCEGWLYDAVRMMGYTRDRAGVEALALRAQRETGADAGYVGAFTRYPVCHFAYAEPGRSYTVIGYTTRPMTIDKIHNTFAHESCHIFGAADESLDTTTTPPTCLDPCDVEYGGLSVPNHNSPCCAWSDGTRPGHDRFTCLMGDGAPPDMCEFTRWQIGWNNRAMRRQVNGPSGGRAATSSIFPSAAARAS